MADPFDFDPDTTPAPIALQLEGAPVTAELLQKLKGLGFDLVLEHELTDKQREMLRDVPGERLLVRKANALGGPALPWSFMRDACRAVLPLPPPGLDIKSVGIVAALALDPESPIIFSPKIPTSEKP